MENEIMNYEDTDITEVEEPEVEMTESGMSAGVAMLIGAGLTIATGAVVKLGKKLFTAYKAKKESKKTEDEELEDADE